MYNYEKQKQAIFTEEGQRMFLRIRDRVKELLKESGAVRMQEIISKECGDNWIMMACIDRLIELKELKEVTSDNTPGQHRVFVAL